MDSESNLPNGCRFKRGVLFFLLAALGLALDLATKRALFDWLGLPGEYNALASDPHSPLSSAYWLIPNVFGFQTSLNEGALFGMGQGMTAVFIGASFAAFIAIFLWFWREGYKSRTLTVAFGLIVAGIAGNLWDRLALHSLVWPDYCAAEIAGKPIHAVRDWILIMIGRWPWPNFNLADTFLVIGVALVFCCALFAPPKTVDEAPKQ